jgi:hypothetical protein
MKSDYSAGRARPGRSQLDYANTISRELAPARRGLLSTGRDRRPQAQLTVLSH